MKKVKVFSRHLLGLGAFLGSTLFIQAQGELAMADISKDSAPVLTTTKSTNVADHSKDAIKQLSAHIRESVIYPDYLKDYEIGGTVVVEVKLNEKGKIINSQIVDRNNTSLDGAVLKSLKSFKGVQTDESTYQGVNTVHIPIRFTE